MIIAVSQVMHDIQQHDPTLITFYKCDTYYKEMSYCHYLANAHIVNTLRYAV